MTELEYVRRELSAQLSGCEGLVGALLLGSISAGMDGETSDYDIQLVFEDEALSRHPEYPEPKLVLRRHADVWGTSVSELAATDRGVYHVGELLHAMYILDDEGKLREIVGRLVRYPHRQLYGIVSAKLDGHYNGAYRSLKCRRRGFIFGMHQMAAKSMEYGAAYGGFLRIPLENRVAAVDVCPDASQAQFYQNLLQFRHARGVFAARIESPENTACCICLPLDRRRKKLFKKAGEMK